MIIKIDMANAFDKVRHIAFSLQSYISLVSRKALSPVYRPTLATHGLICYSTGGSCPYLKIP
jgi:hypothetical protein